MPGQSLVEFLLKQGFDVYLIEWGRPRREHQHLTLEDHVLDRLPNCVARVLEHSGQDEVSLLGYCLGGLLAVSDRRYRLATRERSADLPAGAATR